MVALRQRVSQDFLARPSQRLVTADPSHSTMPPDAPSDDDEQYDSSQDSDFAPDAAAEPTSDQSDSEDDASQPNKKRSRDGEVEAEDAGYNNSGDEAIIDRGKKRQRKSKGKANEPQDDEGGEGGLIKTRRQRAAE